MRKLFLLLIVLLKAHVCIGQDYDFKREKITLTNIDTSECLIFVRTNALIYTSKEDLKKYISEMDWGVNRSLHDSIINNISKTGSHFLTMNDRDDNNPDPNNNAIKIDESGIGSLLATNFLTKVLLTGNCRIVNRHTNSEVKNLITKVKKRQFVIVIEFRFRHGRIFHQETIGMT